MGWKEAGIRVMVHVGFASAFLCVVVYVFVRGPDLYVQTASPTWPSTWGEVTDCCAASLDEFDTPEIVDLAAIEFRYTVGGIEYQSTDVVSITPALQLLRDGASTRGRVRVHYCPHRPQSSVLHTGISAVESVCWMAVVGYIVGGYSLVTFARDSLGASSARLHDQATPVENAAIAGLAACLFSSKWIIPGGVYLIAGYESRFAVVVAWGLLIAVVWLAAKLVHVRNVRRLVADVTESGVLVG